MAISATTSVLTGDDWKLAKDVRPGDWVFNHLGKPVKVKTVQMFRSEECYRVTFDDYLSVDGDKHLSFFAENTVKRVRESKYKGIQKTPVNLPKIPCTEMLNIGLHNRGNHSEFSVPTTQPVELPTQPQSIPPFVFGIWFMGAISKKQISIPNEFAEYIYEKFQENGYKIVDITKRGSEMQRFRTKPCIWTQLHVRYPTKVPFAYLNGSKDQRLDLIRGMLCVKNCKPLPKNHKLFIRQREKYKSFVLQYLSESLGAKTQYRIDQHRDTYDISILRLKPFLEQHEQKKPTRHYARRYVKSIEPIPAQLCVHIETDKEDGSFLAGEGFIPCL